MDKLIFLVDDIESILITGASILENDYLILTMPSAEKMFSLLLKKKPDLIILDVEMPEMSGTDALAKLKENPDWANIPVLFLTGHIDDSIIDNFINIGACCVVSKFEMKDTLLPCVKNCLEDTGTVHLSW